MVIPRSGKPALVQIATPTCRCGCSDAVKVHIIVANPKCETFHIYVGQSLYTIAFRRGEIGRIRSIMTGTRAECEWLVNYSDWWP